MTTPCIIDPSIPLDRKGYAKRHHKDPVSGVKCWHEHRWVLMQELGRPLLPGMHACHACNRKNCISTAPGHLYEGTPAENEADKQRPRNPDVVAILGSPRTNHAPLVPDIRARHAAGMPITAIARLLDIPRTSVGDIVHRRTHKLEQAG